MRARELLWGDPEDGAVLWAPVPPSSCSLSTDAGVVTWVAGPSSTPAAVLDGAVLEGAVLDGGVLELPGHLDQLGGGEPVEAEALVEHRLHRERHPDALSAVVMPERDTPHGVIVRALAALRGPECHGEQDCILPQLQLAVRSE